VALIIIAGISLSSCGTSADKHSTITAFASPTTTTTLPPPETFTVVLPESVYKNLMLSDYRWIGPNQDAATAAEFFFQGTCYSKSSGELATLGTITQIGNSSSGATFTVHLTSSEVAQWDSVLLENYDCPDSATHPYGTTLHSPLQDYQNTAEYLRTLVNYPYGSPPITTTPTTPAPAWSPWLSSLKSLLNQFSASLAICDGNTLSRLSSSLKALANRAPDQNGLNDMYGDVTSLSLDGQMLRQGSTCSDVRSSFLSDMSNLKSDLHTEGHSY